MRELAERFGLAFLAEPWVLQIVIVVTVVVALNLFAGILANFFGGLTIYLDRPFAVGEWIRSPDKEIEGTVEYTRTLHMAEPAPASS